MEALLKKANSVTEIYQTFEIKQPLTKDQVDFYEELYRENIKKLRIQLTLNQIPNKCFYITGQSG